MKIAPNFQRLSKGLEEIFNKPRAYLKRTDRIDICCKNLQNPTLCEIKS